MKRTIRIFALLLTLCLLFPLASCGAPAPENPNWGGSDDGGLNGGADGGVTNQGGSSAGNPNYGGIENEGSLDTGIPGDSVEEGPDGPLDENKTGESPFISTETEPTSTFSSDVDTASYTYLRKLIRSGYNLFALQNAGINIRTEEMLNYFRYRVTAPEEGSLFGYTTTLTDCPWNPESSLLYVTLSTPESIEQSANNLVFLIDVSGSMRSNDKLPLLQSTFAYLIDNLTENDVVSIVTYSGKEQVVLSGCPGNQKDRILSAINSLSASGSTNGEAGLTEAYRLAEANFIPDGNNRIIMASDGDLNVGISSEDQLKSYVEGKRDQGVYLSVLGFGTGNYRDSKMETIADYGNGSYYYIDGETEAEKIFATELLSTLYTVAEDVKLQLTFDPAFVSAYRLIGYENRALTNEEFTDDTKDAGEVGAGHQVTVCYELILTGTAPDATAPIATLKVRQKAPGAPISQEESYAILASGANTHTADEVIHMNAIVMLAMLIRESNYLPEDGSVNLFSLLTYWENGASEATDPYQAQLRAEFYELLLALAPQE